MLKAEVRFRQLFNKAIKGDLSAARLITKMVIQYSGPEAKSDCEVRFEVLPDDKYYLKKQTEAEENP